MISSEKGLIMTDREWASQARCFGGDPDSLFVQGAAQNDAKKLCNRCPVRYECLGDALDNRIEWGVWGGMTERERRALLRRHPHVVSWSQAIGAAVTERRQAVSAGVTSGLPYLGPSRPVLAPPPTPNPASDPELDEQLEILLELIRKHAVRGVWARPDLGFIRSTAHHKSLIRTKPHILLGRLERSHAIKVYWGVPIEAIAVIGTVSNRQLKALNRAYAKDNLNPRQKSAA